MRSPDFEAARRMSDLLFTASLPGQSSDGLWLAFVQPGRKFLRKPWA